MKKSSKKWLSLLSIMALGNLTPINILAEDSTSVEETSIETQAVKSDDSTTTESSNEGTSKVEYASEYLEKYQEQGVNFEEYGFVWGDEFEGDQLNRDDWNVELHEPGWVNEEWQEYIDDEKVLQVNDGKLVIQPVKESVDGQDLYYSGRVNTQNKQNFKYGFFEAKVRVPKGQGYLPAFWLMSADENVYGQWPRAGEIDIMEIHGSDTTKSYGTLHYGNPHRESQGEMQLTKGDFNEEYHIFALEWLPGKINWFVDGQLIHSESEWYSKTEGQGEITYPAPFDSEFYVILNLAVGGSWVGYPDDSTEFEGQSFDIDYVRVYQKETYDENVKKPLQEFTAREADESGNYIVNGDFSESEELLDEDNWVFLTTQGGEAEASIADNQLSINTTSAGEVDYSVQLVQANLPMEQNYQYQVSFTAWSDQERLVKVNLTGPDNGYIRYFEEQELELTSEPQMFEFEFTMNEASDENGRLEFNLGAYDEASPFYLKGVSVKRLEKTEASDTAESKTVLSDGNYVYNGKFQEGDYHIGFWQWDGGSIEEAISPLEDGRRLIIAGGKESTLMQEQLPLDAGVEYEISLDIEAEEDFTLKGKIGESTFELPVEKGLNPYRYSFTLEENQIDNTDLILNFDNVNEVRVDNVKVQENRLIKNGSFDAGLTGYNTFIDASANATVVVDSLNEDNAADFTIYNTGDQAWKIQLNQEQVPLIKGKTYRLTFKAKSSVDRSIMYALQRDGKADDVWTTYLPEQIVPLKADYQEYSYEFAMEEPDDLQAMLSISLGAVEDKVIEQEHRVVIDDIELEEVN